MHKKTHVKPSRTASDFHREELGGREAIRGFARMSHGIRSEPSSRMHEKKHAEPSVTVIDYNGEGIWSREAILERYSLYAAQEGIVERDLSPMEFDGHGARHWVHPVMDKVDGIEAGDLACIRIGLEFIEEDAKFPLGRILKSNTARALRRAPLTEAQKVRIRRRVFGMLRAGQVPHEYRQYAKLVRKIGFDLNELPEVSGGNVYVLRYWNYFRRFSPSISTPRTQ